MRISEILGARVTAAIEALPVLAAAREQIDWEIAPALMPDRLGGVSLAYMVAVSVPMAGSVEGDKILYMAPLGDPDAPQATVTSLVHELYQRCEADNDQHRARGNGHRMTPGGLVTP